MIIPNIEWIKNWVAEHGGGVEWDETPTEGSRKAVRSGGVFSWVSNLLSSLTLTWDKITNKPETMPPTAHTHTKSQVTDFPETMPPTAHTHTKSQVTGLAGALAAKRDKDDLFVRCWRSQSGEVGLMKPISRDSSGNFRWSDGVHILVFAKSSGTTFPWQITGGGLGDAAEGSITDTTISFLNIGLTLTETNLNIALSGLSSSGEPLDPNVAELFSESNTSTAANPDLNNKALQNSVNKLIDAKVGSIDDALDALNGEVA